MMDGLDVLGAPEAMVRKPISWIWPVIILTIVYALNFADRQIVIILSEPIKKELHLRDWQLGAITGFSFALIYGAMALPVARLADRTDRSRLIGIVLAIWSAGTFACGVAASFLQLAIARIAVGLGESGYTPAAHSLISECVPKARRVLAFSIFSAGLAIGGMLALALGGVIAELWGWRKTFFFAGVLGFILVPVVLLLIRDPRRASKVRRHPAGQQATASVMGLMKIRSFLLFVLGGGLFATGVYGMQAFTYSFISRNHGDEIGTLAQWVNQHIGTNLHSTGVVGPVLGLSFGAAGIGSAAFSGWFADRLVERDVRYFSYITAAAQVLALPAIFIALTTPHLLQTLGAFTLAFFLLGFVNPPISACIQRLAHSTNRATASAISLLALVGFGNGLGPLSIGILSDVAGKWNLGSGPALRIGMLIGIAMPISASAILLIFASRYLAREIDPESAA